MGEGETLRFQTNHITHQLTLVSLLIAHLTSPINHIHRGHPFFYCELVLACEVVHVADETAHDLSHARSGFGACGVDDMLGEIGIESGIVLDIVGVAVGRCHGEEIRVRCSKRPNAFFYKKTLCVYLGR